MREWLKKIRTDSGMTQREVADKLGIVQHYYSMIENGERQQKMTIELAAKLSKVFGVTIEYIMEQEN